MLFALVLVLLLVVLATRDAQRQQALRIAHLEATVQRLQSDAPRARDAAAPTRDTPVPQAAPAVHTPPPAPVEPDRAAGPPPAQAASSFVGPSSAPPTPTPEPAPPTVAPPVPVPATPNPVGRFLAEHALSIAGGGFVLVAIVLFLTYAINAGWINETLRTVLAALLAVGLAVCALRIARGLDPAERTGRAIGSLHGVLAGTACGIAILDLMVATRRYDLLDATPAFAAALLVGAATLQLARRWRSQDLAAFGMVVALLAPVLVGAPPSGATLAMLALALLVALACAVVEGWPRLGVVTVLVTAPQVLSWLDDPSRSATLALAVIAAWWLAHQAAMVAPALLDPRRALRGSVVGTCVGSSFAALAMLQGWMYATYNEGQRPLLFGAFAFVHLVLGVALLRRRRSELVGLAAATCSVAATIAAFAVIAGADEAAVTASLVAEAVGVGVLWWIARSRSALVVSLALALGGVGHLLIVTAPLGELARSELGASSVIAALSVVAAALVARRLALLQPVASLLAAAHAEEHDELEGKPAIDARVARADPADGGAAVARRALELVAWVAGWHAGALALVTLLTPERGSEPPQVAMVALAVWTVGLVAALLARAGGARRDELVVVATIGALAVPVLLAEWITDAGTITLLLVASAAQLALAWTRPDPRLLHLAASAWYLSVAALLLLLGDANPDHALATGVRDAWPTLALLLGATVLLAASTASTLRVQSAPPPRVASALFGVAVAFWLVSATVVRALTDPPGSVQQDAQVALSITWSLLGIGALLASMRIAARGSLARAVRIAGYALLAVSAGKVVLVDTAQLETPFRMAVFLAVGLLLLGAARLEQLLRARDDA